MKKLRRTEGQPTLEFNGRHELPGSFETEAWRLICEAIDVERLYVELWMIEPNRVIQGQILDRTGDSVTINDGGQSLTIELTNISFLKTGAS